LGVRRAVARRGAAEELSSANATSPSGDRLAAPTPLSRGDERSFGEFSLFFDRVMKLPVQEREVGLKPELPRPSETFHMDPKEVERLRKTLALKRRAHLKWEARGKQDTFYLERLERSAVLAGQSPRCDRSVPAG